MFSAVSPLFRITYARALVADVGGRSRLARSASRYNDRSRADRAYSRFPREFLASRRECRPLRGAVTVRDSRGIRREIASRSRKSESRGEAYLGRSRLPGDVHFASGFIGLDATTKGRSICDETYRILQLPNLPLSCRFVSSGPDVIVDPRH